jgi:WD40 repeat protein
MMASGSSLSQARSNQNSTTVTAKNSNVFPLCIRGGYLELTGRATFIKGDPYIRDMKNTACVHVCYRLSMESSIDPFIRRSGHVAEVTSCAWHPKEANTFITSSADSTIRCVSHAVFLPCGPAWLYARLAQLSGAACKVSWLTWPSQDMGRGE